jgi:hypothetical protein
VPVKLERLNFGVLPACARLTGVVNPHVVQVAAATGELVSLGLSPHSLTPWEESRTRRLIQFTESITLAVWPEVCGRQR